jgi:NAD(P)-dependent dehydrogenase (short-subunit alcohol dehydrogenase family)
MNTPTVCITGAGRGLGFALVEAFLIDPQVSVCAVSRNTAKLESIKAQYADRLEIVTAEICTMAGRDKVYSALKARGSLAILLHNAATLAFEPFAVTTEATLRSVYEVNVFAPFLLTQKLLPLLDHSHVVSISSVGGVQGSLKFAGLSAYSSSKSALNCLTEMWSEEYKDTDIIFNCLALGSVETDMFKEAFPGFTAASTPQQMAKYIVSFCFEAPAVMRGKIISLSMGNP